MECNTNLHCINDAEIVSVVFPFQLFYTFGAPESEPHSILYIREVALFWML